MSPLVGSDRGLIDFAEATAERFRELQVRVAFLARDIDTGHDRPAPGWLRALLPSNPAFAADR